MMKRIMCLAACLCLGAALGPARAETAGAFTLRQKITQKLMLDLRNWSDNPSPTPEERKAFPAFTQMNDTVRGFLSSYQPGGIILFAQNTPDTAATLTLVEAMEEALAASGAPRLFIGIDQEGGRITRLGEGTSLPGNMALGALGSGESAYQAGRIIGDELAALGVNMDFAPDVDVNNNPENPVINIRSFGEDPARVAALGVQFSLGLKDAGVLPVVKHFPGHGDTQTDSHVALPRVDKEASALRDMELLPFQAAVDAGVPVVMSAHIQYPALDDTKALSLATGEELILPATLSRRILTDVLRGEMGFSGLIITDAMNMDAIAKHFGDGEALVRAFEAGVDLALMPIEIACPADIQALENALSEVEEAVAEGRLSEAEIDASLVRILALKETLPPRDARPLAARLEAARGIVGSPAHKAAEREMAAATLALLRDDNTLPFLPQAGQSLLVIAANPGEAAALRFGANRLMAEGKIPALEIMEYVYNGKTAPEGDFDTLLAKADFAVMTSRIAAAGQLAPGQWQSDFPLAASEKLMARGTPYAVLSLLLPQDAALYPQAPALLLLFNPTGMGEAALGDQRYAFGPSLPAAMDVLFGAAQAKGRLPVTLYALDANREIDMNKVLHPLGFGLE